MSGMSGGVRRESHTRENALMVTATKTDEHLDDPPLYQMRVAAALAPMHSEPLVASQQVSQQLSGHDVDVMDVEGDWVRARGEDDYEGWMHTGFLQSRDRPLEILPSRLVSLGCMTERDGGGKRNLPLRAFLADNERVISGEALDFVRLTNRFPMYGGAIAKSAHDLFPGTSYVWGGVTPWGADCSGLVQCVYALHGRMLPRDAWQQAELGMPVSGDFDALLPGDLLFFSDRPDKRVTHVGIALGGGQMVHLALGRGGYAVETMSSNDPYVAKLREKYLFARRLL
jgi:gamma-D-glutamyl-L-lysine dipeptidyl-peptidase